MALKKPLLWIIVMAPLLLLAALALLVLTINPNRLKPGLYQAAAERGLDLEITGDINWQFFPDIGFSLGQVTLRETQAPTAKPLAQIEEASVSVQLMPLLRREILVNGVTLTDATANVDINAEGRSNWSSINTQSSPDAAETAETDTGQTEAATPQLEVARLRLNNLNLNYENAQTDQSLVLRDVNLHSENLALDGSSFPIKLELQAEVSGLPPIDATLAGPIALHLDQRQLSTDGASLVLSSGDARIQLTVNNSTNWGDALKSEGRLHVAPFDLRPWLQALDVEITTQDSGSLSAMSLDLPFSVNGSRYELTQIRLNIDDTELTGDLSLETGDTLSVSSRLKGTRLNLDRYLPPAGETTEPSAAASAATAEPSPLPLELLRSLDLELTANFDQITAKELDFRNPQLEVVGKDGLIQLQKLQSQLADGTIESSGTLDARGSDAQLKMNLATRGVDINSLLQTLADIDALHGKAQLLADITSRGATQQQLMDNLAFTAEAASEELRLVPVNLEQRFCQAISMLQGKAPPDFAWPAQTEFEPIKLQLSLAEQTLKLDGLTAQIAKLLGRAEGAFDLKTGQFNLPFNLSLGDFAGNIPGCLPIPEKWRTRALPIRCKGQIDSIGPTTCLPDRELISALVKERVESKVEQKRDEVENKAEEKARQLLKEKLGDERSKSAEDTIRGFLNKRKPDAE